VSLLDLDQREASFEGPIGLQIHRGPPMELQVLPEAQITRPVDERLPKGAKRVNVKSRER